MPDYACTRLYDAVLIAHMCQHLNATVSIFTNGIFKALQTRLCTFSLLRNVRG